LFVLEPHIALDHFPGGSDRGAAGVRQLFDHFIGRPSCAGWKGNPFSAAVKKVLIFHANPRFCLVRGAHTF
jgi:hypothetical protein